MNYRDQLLLEKAYIRMYENAPVLIPRRSVDERQKAHQIAINKQIQEYIKNGSRGNLDLKGAPITSLPDNLVEVGGDLNLAHSQIALLPAELKRIKGSLYLFGSKVESLPDKLQIDRSIYADKSNLKLLPAGLKVGGGIWLNGTPITSLPDGLNVGGDLSITDCPLADKYTDEQIRQICPSVNKIIRS